MKKTLIIIIILFITIIAVFSIYLMNFQKAEKQMKQFNSLYEQYLDKTALGSEVATVINRAIDNNEKYEIEKNDKGTYIEDDKYSLKVFIKLEEEGEYYSMERINAFKITEFVNNFSLEDFKCTKILYHDQTKRVSQIYFDIVV